MGSVPAVIARRVIDTPIYVKLYFKKCLHPQQIQGSYIDFITLATHSCTLERCSNVSFKLKAMHRAFNSCSSAVINLALWQS